MRPNNNQIFSSLPVVSNQTSLPQWSDMIVRASFQVVVAGTNTGGTLQVQVSNDQAVGLPANQYVPTNWSNLGSSVAVSGGNAVYLISEIEMSYEYVRLVYTNTVAGVQTVALVADVSGSLNNKYFLLSSGTNSHLYYVWFNINSAGTDPAIAGRTGIEVDGATNASAATLGAAMATAIAAAGSSNDFTTSGTSTVTITNKVAGPYTPASDGTAATGFTFNVTTPTGTISARMKSMAL